LKVKWFVLRTLANGSGDVEEILGWMRAQEFTAVSWAMTDGPKGGCEPAAVDCRSYLPW
jgi:hypothetical protein